MSIGITFENGVIFGALYFGLGICFSGGTQIKLNVGQFEAAKRKEIVDSAAQMADKWVREDQKEILIKKSNEPLDKLMNGLTETAAHFQGIVDGAALMADQLAKKDTKETLRNKSDESLGKDL